MSEATRQDLAEFCKLFNVKIEDTVNIPVFDTNNFFYYRQIINDQSATEQITDRIEPGYRLIISDRQLERLIKIIKSKGYYHDDAYNIKMQEEDLILSHPELKALHDQYKTFLYMLVEEHHYK